MKFSVKTDISEKLAAQIAERCDKAAMVVALQVKKDTEPYVPMLTGSLKNRTRVEGSTIIYPGPYARFLYYGKVMVDSETGKGPMHFVDKQGNEVFRFRYGSRLVPTSRDLVFTTDFHPDAQAHWFEASKAQNKEKWELVAQRAVDKFG